MIDGLISFRHGQVISCNKKVRDSVKFASGCGGLGESVVAYVLVSKGGGC